MGILPATSFPTWPIVTAPRRKRSTSCQEQFFHELFVVMLHADAFFDAQ